MLNVIKKKNIEAIIFDFDGTLVDYVENDLLSLESLAKSIDEKIDLPKFFEISISEIYAFHELVKSGKEDPRNMHKARLRGTFKKMNLGFEDHYVKVYQENLIKYSAPYDGAVDLLEKLKGKVKLAILTNAYDGVEQRARIASSGLDIYFDEIIIAGEENLFKPDIKIFKITANRLKTIPEKCLSIGDSYASDIMGARECKMHAIHLMRQGKHDKYSSIYQCRDISDLEMILL